MTRGVHTTGLYYNKALLDRAGLEPPRTIADLKAMVQPLAALGVAPLVHLLGRRVLQPDARHLAAADDRGASGDPLEFAERTVRGEVGYDSPEWIEAFQTIADLRTSGVLLEGSGAMDYATMQQLLPAGEGGHDVQRHLAPAAAAGRLADRSRSTCTSRRLRWSRARRASPDPGLDRVRDAGQGQARAATASYAFLEYASRPEVDRPSSRACRSTRPSPASNVAIDDPVAQEFLPMFEDAITPLDWLWEPEITAEIDSQVQALVKGDTDPAAVGKAVQAVAEGLRSSGRSYYP